MLERKSCWGANLTLLFRGLAEREVPRVCVDREPVATECPMNPMPIVGHDIWFAQGPFQCGSSLSRVHQAVILAAYALPVKLETNATDGLHVGFV